MANKVKSLTDDQASAFPFEDAERNFIKANKTDVSRLIREHKRKVVTKDYTQKPDTKVAAIKLRKVLIKKDVATSRKPKASKKVNLPKNKLRRTVSTLIL